MSVRNTVKSIQDIMRQDTGVDGDAQRISQLCWMFFLKIIDDQDQQLELMQDGYRSPIPKKLQWRIWAADPEGATGDELLTFINNDLFPTLKALPTAGKQGDRRRVVKDVKDIWCYEHRIPDGQKAYSMTKPIRVEHFKPCVEWWGGPKIKGRQESEVAWRFDFQALLKEAKARAKPHWDAAEKTSDPDEARLARRTGDGICDAVFNLDVKNPHVVAADQTRKNC